MKLLLSILFLTSLSDACEDFTGKYSLASGSKSMVIEVDQNGCKDIYFRFHDYTFNSYYLLNSRKYKEVYDKHQNSRATKEMEENTIRFVSARYQSSRVIVDEYYVTRGETLESCKGKFSYQSFECTKMTFSLGLSENYQGITWRRTGDVRRGDGWYSGEEYELSSL